VKKARCTVVFRTDRVGPYAMLMSRGHSINVMNFPSGTVLTRGKKLHARRLLMRGCAELSRR